MMIYFMFSDRHQSSSEAVLLSLLSTAEPNRTNSLLHLYEGWTESICSHLERKFSSVVKLPVEAILNLVTRALSVLPRDLSTRPTLAKTRLLCVLPFIHVATLRILKALIGAGRLALPVCGIYLYICRPRRGILFLIINARHL